MDRLGTAQHRAVLHSTHHPRPFRALKLPSVHKFVSRACIRFKGPSIWLITRSRAIVIACAPVAGCAASEVVAQPKGLSSFSKRFEAKEGEVLIVRPLTSLAISDVASLLTNVCFQQNRVQQYKKFVNMQIRNYLLEHIDLLPKTIVLTAYLQIDRPISPPEGSDPFFTLPLWNNQPSESSEPTETLVGVAELSFCSSTRSRYLTLNSPDDAAYICNMAVDKRHRRKGVASALLQAAEEIAAQQGFEEVFLHVRFQDRPAELMYLRNGYKVHSRDSFFVKLLGLDQRNLMVKEVNSQEGNTF